MGNLRCVSGTSDAMMLVLNASHRTKALLKGPQNSLPQILTWSRILNEGLPTLHLSTQYSAISFRLCSLFSCFFAVHIMFVVAITSKMTSCER